MKSNKSKSIVFFQIQIKGICILYLYYNILMSNLSSVNQSILFKQFQRHASVNNLINGIKKYEIQITVFSIISIKPIKSGQNICVYALRSIFKKLLFFSTIMSGNLTTGRSDDDDNISIFYACDFNSMMR